MYHAPSGASTYIKLFCAERSIETVEQEKEWTILLVILQRGLCCRQSPAELRPDAIWFPPFTIATFFPTTTISSVGVLRSLFYLRPWHFLRHIRTA